MINYSFVRGARRIDVQDVTELNISRFYSTVFSLLIIHQSAAHTYTSLLA
jgi:hypothetical protein